MFEKFDEIFEAVANKHGILDWWELFDSALFDEVCYEIATANCYYVGPNDSAFDICYDNVKGFREWNNMMCDEL